MLSLCALTCFSISCSDSKDNNEDVPGAKLTPEEHKAKIETIGKDFVAKFKSAENEKIAKSIYDLQELISDSNFEDLFDQPATAGFSALLNSLTSVMSKNDIHALTRSASDVDEYRWAKYTGIYTLSGKTWRKAPASKKVEIKFNSKSVGNAACVLLATYSDEKNYTNVEGYLIEIPGKVNMTMKVGDQEVLNFSAKINLATDQESVDADVNLTLSTNYVWTTKVAANGSKATVDYKMMIRGEEVMSAAAELTGNKMTDPDNLDQNSDNLDKVFSNLQFSYRITDITIAGKGNLKEMIKADNNLDDDVERGDEAASKKYAEASAKVFNDYATMAMAYTGENENIANLRMKADWEEQTYYIYYPNYEEKTWKRWETYPVLVFSTDNSEFAIEDYFTESSFSSLIKAVENLANEFTKMLNLDPVEL